MENISSHLDVIVIGELNVDIILYGMDQLPSVGKEVIAKEMKVTLGSSSAIFASNLSSVGTKVGFIGKIGNDNFGKIVIGSLEDRKVDTSHILRSDVLNTGITMVLSFDQDRANVTYPGAMDELYLSDIDLGFLKQAKHLHLSSTFLQPGIKNDLPMLFSNAKKLGLTTSLDPQWDPQEEWDLPLEELLPYVDVFMPNEKELMGLTRTGSIKKGIDKIKAFANIVVVKNGSEGSWAWNGEEIIHQTAFLNSNVVDCTGAGDSFNAGFVHQFINEATLSKCLEFGSLLGAINTTRAGGIGAFSDLALIKSIAEETFKYKI
ncbi:MAG: carbohydrate kinase family protein [Bacteroidetes bacterium]|nr:MAG: carbohydrate kinase family protein [Bacteroidota bacterium]